MSQFGGANPIFFGAGAVSIDPVSQGARQSIRGTTQTAQRQEEAAQQASIAAARLQAQREDAKARRKIEELRLKADQTANMLEAELAEKQLANEQRRLETQQKESESNIARNEAATEMDEKRLSMAEEQQRLGKAQFILEAMEESTGVVRGVRSATGQALRNLDNETDLILGEYAARGQQIETEEMREQNRVMAEATTAKAVLEGGVVQLSNFVDQLNRVGETRLEYQQELSEQVNNVVGDPESDSLVDGSLSGDLIRQTMEKISERGLLESMARRGGQALLNLIEGVQGDRITPTGREFVDSVTAEPSGLLLESEDFRILRAANGEPLSIVPSNMLPENVTEQLVGGLQAEGSEFARKYGDSIQPPNSIVARGFDAMTGEGRPLDEETAKAMLSELLGGQDPDQVLLEDADGVRQLLQGFMAFGSNLNRHGEVLQQTDGGNEDLERSITDLGKAYYRGANEMLRALDIAVPDGEAITDLSDQIRESLATAMSDPEQARIVLRDVERQVEEMAANGEELPEDAANLLREMVDIAEETAGVTPPEEFEQRVRDIQLQTAERQDALQAERVGALREERERLRTEAEEERARRREMVTQVLVGEGVVESPEDLDDIFEEPDEE